MKKLILLVIVTVSLSFSQVTSQNSMGLSRWAAGNKLNAGTIGDTAVSNASLNRNFDLISALWLRQHDNKGWFTSIYGDSTANLSIGLAGSQHNKRVLFRDSVYMYYNLFSEGSAIFAGNVTIGGYTSLDSIYGGLVVRGGSIDLRYDGDPATASMYMDALTDSTTINGYTYIHDLDAGGFSSDSAQSTTIHAVLFNSEQIAGSTLNDTSALFTEWSTTSGDNVPIVRMKYLHKSGIKYVTARYYAYSGGGGDGWETQMSIGSITQADSDVNGSYGSTVQVNQLNVSGLTAGTLYDLQFKVSINTSGTSYFKELIITAESN